MRGRVDARYRVSTSPPTIAHNGGGEAGGCAPVSPGRPIGLGTIVQTCIFHLLRNSFRYAARQDWDKLAKALRPVCTAPAAEAAEERFLESTEAWGKKYPAIVQLWSNAWVEFVPSLAYDVEIRNVICATNAIESVNARIRTAVRARGHFPTEAAALECGYRALMSLEPTDKFRRSGPWVGRRHSTPSRSPSPAALEPTGLTARRRHDAAILVLSLMRSLTQEALDSTEEGDEDWDRLTTHQLTAHAARFPALTRAVAEGAFVPTDDDPLAFGLTCVLDGVQGLVERADRK